MTVDPIENLEDARRRVEQLIENYKTNLERLHRYYTDETVREWASAFFARLTPYDVTPEPEELSGEVPLTDVLELEKKAVFSEMDRLKAEIQVVKLLMLQLPDVDYDLIAYRYFQGYTISQVCQTLFISRSTFYRRHDLILDTLALHYHHLFSRHQIIT
ncbi:MAG: helix-turn-helix domain-containing protein [Peptoniphilaceae bacterium]|nr:helix-turn-helix domain-containing protein [Peptoniphilaceae bacterium]MDY6085278.1 helix-turn-helix domain-containing protein [Peptoniphilaceae bacterium]